MASGGEGQAVPVYAVERVLPGATLAMVEAIEQAAEEAARASAARGNPVRYLRSTFIPGESRCHSLFEAPNAAEIQELNDIAQLPYSRIVLAVSLRGGEPATGGPAGSPDIQE